MISTVRAKLLAIIVALVAVFSINIYLSLDNGTLATGSLKRIVVLGDIRANMHAAMSALRGF